MSKTFIYAIVSFISLYLFFQMTSLPDCKWAFKERWVSELNTTSLGGEEIKDMTSKLRDSVTFLPLKDLRFADKVTEGNTWFMSSLNDTQDKESKSPYLMLPSEESKGRVLCLKGRNTKDGSWNSYALAWPGSLPYNGVLMKGLTFITYDNYTYHNMWHGLKATLPFVGWHINNKYQLPERWILYHKGEVKTFISPWIKTVMEATFEGHFKIEDFESIYGNESTHGSDVDGGASACFEEALVMRHHEERMSSEDKLKASIMIRCKARMYCNVTSDATRSVIGMTLLMRNGSRSFKNSSAVISIFQEACQKVEGCNLRVAYSDNLTV